jgi:tetratricopeptide (TPR) repeat protein
VTESPGGLLQALKEHRGALVVGPPSAGVSTLLSSVQREAIDAGWSVVRVRGTAASTRPPLEPFAAQVPLGTGGTLVDRVRAVVQGIAPLGARTIVMVDEAHLFDEASVIALRHLHESTKARFLVGVREESDVPDGVVSVIDDGPVIGLPHVLHEVVALDEAEQEVVDVLRLASPLGRAIVERLASPEVIDALVRRGVIEVARRGGRNELWLADGRHDDDRPSSDEARRRLLDALESTASRRYGDQLRLSLLRSELGILDDASVLLGAARELELLHHRSMFAAVTDGLSEPLPACLDAGLRYARLALDATHRMPELVVVVDLLGALGRTDEAADLIRRLDEYVVDANDAALATRLRAMVRFIIGQPDAALGMLRDAEGATDDGQHRTWFRIARLQIEGVCGRYRDAVATGDLLVADGVRLGNATGAGAVGFALVRVGRCADAAALLEEMFASLTGDEDPRFVVAETYAHLMALGTLGRLDEAEERAASAFAVYAVAGNEEQATFALVASAAVALARGRVARAAELADDVIDRLDERDAFGFRRVALCIAVTAHALLASETRTDELLADLDAAPAGVQSFESDVRRAYAWALAARGDVDGAVDVLDEAVDAVRVEGLDGDEVTLLCDLVRLGRAEGVVDRLAALAITTQGPYAALGRDHARGLLDGDGDALDDVAARAAEIGANLLALDALAHAIVAHGRAGKDVRVAAGQHRLVALAAACDGARTPATALLERS